MGDLREEDRGRREGRRIRTGMEWREGLDIGERAEGREVKRLGGMTCRLGGAGKYSKSQPVYSYQSVSIEYILQTTANTTYGLILERNCSLRSL